MIEKDKLVVDVGGAHHQVDKCWQMTSAWAKQGGRETQLPYRRRSCCMRLSTTPLALSLIEWI